DLLALAGDARLIKRCENLGTELATLEIAEHHHPHSIRLETLRRQLDNLVVADALDPARDLFERYLPPEIDFVAGQPVHPAIRRFHPEQHVALELRLGARQLRRFETFADHLAHFVDSNLNYLIDPLRRRSRINTEVPA